MDGLTNSTRGITIGGVNTTGTTYSPCEHGHVWYWSSSSAPMEGTPCQCGRKLYHMEICKCCGNLVAKHKDKEI